MNLYFYISDRTTKPFETTSFNKLLPKTSTTTSKQFEETTQTYSTGSVNVHILKTSTATPESPQDLLQCRFGDDLYYNNQTWSINNCTKCQCLNGNINCSQLEHCRLTPGIYEKLKLILQKIDCSLGKNKHITYIKVGLKFLDFV